MGVNLERVGELLGMLRRKKSMDSWPQDESKFKRCLSTFELTLIGIGSTVGVGLYVIAAEVARYEAGPGILLSFTIAAVVSLLSAVCYAEMACVVPKTGSAYTFAYVTCGEFIAFFVGWNMLMEMIIGAAGVGRATSEYVDSCFHFQLSAYLSSLVSNSWWPRDLTALLGDYPDVLGFICVIAVTGILLLGVKASSQFNVALTILNILILLLFFITGCFYLDTHNLTHPDGFLPFGAAGVLSGAASCFYAFVGFDCITTMCEETHTPTRSIPRAIVYTLIVCYACYMMCSVVLVLVMPYDKIPSTATLAEIFQLRDHLTAIKYLVDIGAVFALLASLVGGLLPIPRIVYAIAQDGLLPSIFGEVWADNEIPATALIACGLFSAFFALAIDLGGLVEMMSIGTLIAYTVVAISVILLRYNPEYESLFKPEPEPESGKKPNYTVALGQSSNDVMESSADKMSISSTNRIPPFEKTTMSRNSSIFSFDESVDDDLEREAPTLQSYRFVVFAVSVCVVLLIPVAYLLMNQFDDIIGGNIFYIATIILLKATVSALVLMVALQPQHKINYSLIGCPTSQSQDSILPNQEKPHFRVPNVPFLPMMAVFCNLCLIARLHWLTWIRFVIWCFVGLVVYFGYSVKNSKLNPNKRSEYHLVNNG